MARTEETGPLLSAKPKLVFLSLTIFPVMLFFSFFKSLVGKDIVVELKNDLNIAGTLHSVDQYLNFKLTDITVLDTQVRS